MPRNPAVLFYTDDFLAGTYTMTYEQKGQYITLLCLQHQQGHLSQKRMLSICGAYDPDIWCKFQLDADGLYFQKRMEEETQKRNAYCETRRSNKMSKPTEKETHDDTYVDTHVEHMSEHMGNGNSNTNNKPNIFIKPTVEEVNSYCIERKNNIDGQSFIDFYDSKGWMIGKNHMKDWKAAVRTWERSRGGESNGRAAGSKDSIPKTDGGNKAPSRWGNLGGTECI